MPSKLIVLIIIILVVFLILIIKNIKQKKLSIKNSLIWIFLLLGVIICCFQISNLEKLAELVGIKTVSNMLFFLGFCFLLYVCFSFSKVISEHSKKIRILTQEIALLRKEVMENDKRGK